MKLFILLFLFIVVTCQAHQAPVRRRLIARQGEPYSDDPTLNDQIYEKFKKLAKKYLVALDPDFQTLLVPAIYKNENLRIRDPYNNHVYNPTMSQLYSNPTPSRFNNPALRGQSSVMNPSRYTYSTQPRPVAQTDHSNANREARLAQADKEALSKLSEEDRKLIESRLSPSVREALLTQLEEGKLDDLLPQEENRFGDMNGMGAFSGAAVQIGSSAGRYIGGKLAGTLGAKLGAAAGAYLGAAAASRFVKKSQPDVEYVSADVVSSNTPGKEVQYGTTYGYGAFNV